jgi:hypothetical protein
MIRETRPISPALAALYEAVDHRERFESLLGMSENTQNTGIIICRTAYQRARDEAPFKTEC